MFSWPAGRQLLLSSCFLHILTSGQSVMQAGWAGWQAARPAYCWQSQSRTETWVSAASGLHVCLLHLIHPRASSVLITPLNFGPGWSHSSPRCALLLPCPSGHRARHRAQDLEPASQHSLSLLGNPLKSSDIPEGLWAPLLSQIHRTGQAHLHPGKGFIFTLRLRSTPLEAQDGRIEAHSWPAP